MAFEKILGHKREINELRFIIKEDLLKGSYLFMGNSGIGKKTIAIECAKSINCEDISSAGCSCRSCNKISKMLHPDVFIIEPEGLSDTIKMDSIRDILYESSLKPYEGRKRIFIIDRAENMKKEPQNALLKILEEPPENHVFILISSRTQSLLPTLLSRCKAVKFYPSRKEEVKTFLLDHGLSEEEADLLSHMSMGSIGYALELKKKDLISKRNDLLRDFFFKKSAIMKESVLIENISKDTKEDLKLLLYWYRDLLVSKFIKDKDRLFNIDRYQEIFSYSGRFSSKRLERNILSIGKTMDHLDRNLNPKIAVFDLAMDLKRT